MDNRRMREPEWNLIEGDALEVLPTLLEDRRQP